MTEEYKTFYPTINQSFILILKTLLISIPASFPLIIFLIFEDKLGSDSIYKSLAFMLSYAFTFTWVILLVKKRIKSEGMWVIKWKTTKIPLGKMIIFFFMTIASMILIDPLTALIPMPEWFKELMEDAVRPDIYSFITVVILAPIVEELLFRGIILEAFLKNYSPWKAIIWSALIFGSFHLNPWQFIGGTFTGILIGWVYVRTNSLIPGIFIHFTNNCIAFCLMLYLKNEDNLSDLINSPISYVLLIVASIGILFAGVFLINKKITQQSTNKIS